MNPPPHIDLNARRAAAAQEAAKLSRRADMKQHADKIKQGLDDLDESHAKRAIWELVQNACDLSEECKVIIDFRNEGFAFQHNGKVFDTQNLISLIKQVSSKSADTTEEVGQFGTGFLSTHSFGTKFKLDSFLKTEDLFIRIKEFLIDRKGKDIDELLNKLEDQEGAMQRLINEGEVVENPEIFTRFTYLPESSFEKSNIRDVAKNLHCYFPLVMSLNSSLVEVKMFNPDGTVVIYSKGEEESLANGLLKIPIKRGKDQENVFCLRKKTEGTDKVIQVVLPLQNVDETKKWVEDTARLFLFFPLIGSEDWGCDFLFHCNHFAPKEQRNGIFLEAKNDHTRAKVEANQNFIREATQMIHSFLEKNLLNMADPHNLARVNFSATAFVGAPGDFLSSLQKLWVDKFKQLPLVETSSGRKVATDVFFFSKELIPLEDESHFEAIYQLANRYWEGTIPLQPLAKKWSEITEEWMNAPYRTITLQMLVEKITAEKNLDNFDKNTLKRFYSFVARVDPLKFEKNALLPNIKGRFMAKEELKKAENIDEHYIGIAEKLHPEIPEKFILKEWTLGLGFETYSRNKLSGDLKGHIGELTRELLNNPDSPQLEASTRNSIIQYCSTFPTQNIEHNQSARRRIMSHICDFYGVKYTEVLIPSIKDDSIDYDTTAFSGMCRCFMRDIYEKSVDEENWVESNLPFLKKCLEILIPHQEIKSDVNAARVFPNQINKLCKKEELLRESNFPTAEEDSIFLKDVYAQVYKQLNGAEEQTPTDIREILILNDFASLVPDNQSKSGPEISDSLVRTLEGQESFEKIAHHPNSDLIFDIIDKITQPGREEVWKDFFTSIYDRRAEITLAKIQDPDLKQSLFPILKIRNKEKVKAIGQLAQDPNWEEIIRLGRIAFGNSSSEKANWEFKMAIGKHIEDLVREEIGDQVKGFEITVSDLQDGQDMVVRKNGEIVYYIEVKSRWMSDSSTIMSTNQVKRAVKEKDNYALCSVNMHGYYPSDSDRYKVEKISKILDRIRFLNEVGVDLEPLVAYSIEAEKGDDNVRLTDDFRAIIPMKLIKDGDEMEKFVQFLIDKLILR